MMSVSRRREPYRYEFEPNVACVFWPYEINQHPVDSKPAAADLIDLSPGGCKLDCRLNFRTGRNECKIVLRFRLMSDLEVKGTIVWQQVRAHGFYYGVRFEENVHQLITEELKRYTKTKMRSADSQG